MNPFTNHPHRQDFTWWRHFVFASGIAVRLLPSSANFALHAVIPAATQATVDNDTDTNEDSSHAGGSPGMMGRGRGMRGRGHGGGNREDMTTLHAMFADRDKITRTVRNLPNGAEATTESDDEEIAGLIQEHVPAMEGRIMDNNPLPPMTFHPIFVALTKHADDYTLAYEETDNGIKVKYSSDDPYVVMLVQEHAKLVCRFIKNGMEEIHKPYTLPTTKKEATKSPVATAMTKA